MPTCIHLPPPQFPLMGVNLDSTNAFVIDLSNDNPGLSDVDYVDCDDFGRYIQTLMDKEARYFALGGYLENRVIYTRSEVFAARPNEYRNIHLGVDIWAKAGRPVYCPLEGTVHSFQDNQGFGNYGPTLILEHQLWGEKLYSLYGHLSRADLASVDLGQVLRAGDCLGHLGAPVENGNWPPHLHFQLIKNLEENWGDYPGVCREEDLLHFQANCPNPNLWINTPLLSG
ncbi:MAG: peptidoglycan DD-metalloendopeptidase family protein [Lunatimonas sp.]|uniref:peptidoglycan DD-metalloendopeptidase family protein n=1 Tax=Lunatimonas sp. TaxID=2060141 RepID=UPI00263A90BA|nr:peptidoglycan DD-metalloendopeptidase family protein [Lunatimonas sp.]MCC5939596.1 peptidoglycan DD-metalloendopeptidase family protein [Lunatimonas sp.]